MFPLLRKHPHIKPVCVQVAGTAGIISSVCPKGSELVSVFFPQTLQVLVTVPPAVQVGSVTVSLQSCVFLSFTSSVCSQVAVCQWCVSSCDHSSAKNSFRYSLKKTAAVTAALILGLSVVNAAAGTYFIAAMSYDWILLSEKVSDTLIRVRGKTLRCICLVILSPQGVFLLNKRNPESRTFLLQREIDILFKDIRLLF